jgi:hypothetical protein
MAIHNRYSSWYNVALTINSNTNNLNVYDYVIANSPWRRTSKKLRAFITIAPGVTVSSTDIANPALVIPANSSTTFRDYDLVFINNLGTIAGASGAGGLGVAGLAGSNGGPGGTSLSVNRQFTWLNNNGTIGGGGGGGGAGGGGSASVSQTIYNWSDRGKDCNSGSCNPRNQCGTLCWGTSVNPCCGGKDNPKCCGTCSSSNEGACCTCGGEDCERKFFCDGATVTGTVLYKGGNGGSGEGAAASTSGSAGETASGAGGNGGTLGLAGDAGINSSVHQGGNGGAAGNWVVGFNNLNVQNLGVVLGSQQL